MSNPYRIAIVVPRYGHDVNGGAETLARDYATRLARRMDVTVLTTCARDYRTWADHFPAGEWHEDGVRVLRFPVPVPRDEGVFDALSAAVLTGRLEGPDAEERWMEAQGPISPALEAHLRDEGQSYDCVLFIPYLYATTVRGLPHVGDRAVLVPALHDEPPARLGIFDPVIRQARSLVFSTPEEQEFAQHRFGVSPDRCHLVGAGIDTPPPTDRRAFAMKSGVHRPYVVSVGRVDPSKGVDALLECHREYRRRNPDGADLVLVGRSVMDLPDEPWLAVTGFVTEDEKHNAIAGAAAVVTASPYESLSIVLLEAWAHGRPAVVTTTSDVLVGQVRRAGGGLSFSSPAEYAAAIELLTARPALAWGLGREGWRFARSLDWDTVIDRLVKALPGTPES